MTRLDLDSKTAGGTVAPARKNTPPRDPARSKDPLGDQIKGFEAAECGRRAMPGLPIVVRIDGHAFSQFTRGMARPYEQALADLMVDVTRFIVGLTHAQVGYTQSDEASFIIDPLSRKWADLAEAAGIDARVDDGQLLLPPAAGFMFDGRYQKLASFIAGKASSRFMLGALDAWPERTRRMIPSFDGRVFQVPTRRMAVAAVLWREMDATKNAVSMAARAHFPHSRLQDKSGRQMQEMLFQEHGVNFNDYPARFKRGVYVQRRRFEKELDAATLARIPEHRRPEGPVLRSEVAVLDLPPLSRIRNKVDVLMNGASPILMADG